MRPVAGRADRIASWSDVAKADRSADSSVVNTNPTAAAVPAPVQAAVRDNEIAIALAKKSLDTQKATGAVMNELLTSSVEVARQIAAGYLDARA